MNGVPPNVALIVVSLAAGWVALLPARRVLGAAYHLLALPTGLLLWPCAAVAATLTDSPLSWKDGALGFALLLVVSWGVPMWARRAHESGRNPERPHARLSGVLGYLVTGCVVLGGVTAINAAGVTAAGYDSVFHYALPGIGLADSGRLTSQIAGAYGVVIPSLQAGVATMGGEWTFVVFPMLALTLLAVLAHALWRFAFAESRPAVRAGLVVITVGLLACVPSFVFNSIYVHSQMITATYLLASLVAIRASEADGLSSADRLVWLAVGGLLAGGFALTRPDGLAYAFIPMAVAALGSLPRGRPVEALAFVTPAALLLATIYGAAFVQLGLWNSDKLTGPQAAVMLLALLGTAGAWTAASFHPRREGATLTIGYTTAVVGLATLAALEVERFAMALRNAAVNLLRTGEYGYLWYSLLGMLAVTLLFPALRRRGDWSSRLLFALTAFSAVAFAVHGTTHPGRLSPADSFNRVAFHAVPMLFWYVAAFAGGALSSRRAASVDRRVVEKAA